jgi:hypothetical protein|tara:strand:+ start:654 stop:1085 length:432 start_codon:yes stop_codon:yes gene_type:complete
MNWEKLKSSHCHTIPVEYIYTSTIFDQTEYDKLYENQNNLNHKTWQEFDEKYRVGFQFHNNLTDINFDREVIALWFFKERSDSTAGPIIQLKEGTVKYLANTFLLTTFRNIKFQEVKRKYIRNPVLQLDMKKEKFNSIMSRFK